MEMTEPYSFKSFYSYNSSYNLGNFGNLLLEDGNSISNGRLLSDNRSGPEGSLREGGSLRGKKF